MNDELTAHTGRSAADSSAVDRVYRELNIDSESDLARHAAELDALSAALAHDLRAPVRALDGFSQKLLALPEAELSEDGRRYLAAIGRNAVQLGRMIDGLLTCSRVTRQPLHAHRVLPRGIVDRVLAAVNPGHERHRIDIRVGDLPACYADAKMLECVFSNLIDNALKFTRTRERAVIEIRAVPDERQIRYTISDNGVGFDMRFADKLFGTFQRMHQETTVEGVGIGLAVVQRIIHRHGGRIWAEASPDQGAMFAFTLPACEQDVETDG